ncbi:UNC-like C-terminal-domain-containing protein [Crepidotus variabilis]|uniref:UNC-like C-terminal-domain-containing protein n=1 Tax=Crepidotus variabilis TaxID=179855 RepID=A0A9P6JJM0_9AGAR|nr:UNC-like C-terminal-domain-containing protein [Crepidotus variabilis]
MLTFILIVLCLTLSVFSESTTSNNPFRAIALKVPKKDPEICCLKPSTALERVDDEILLSFEEWKQKQLAGSDQRDPSEQEGAVHYSSGSHGQDANPNPSLSRSGQSIRPPDASMPSGYSTLASVEDQEIAPHFRIPITDRFNYAGLDCSARVHDSHRSAKSASSILSSKKDRYMLGPCNTPKERQFVVVELCDDIRIDTVQMANYEFFSGVFKDFTVSVSKTSTIDDWTFAGTYRAKNVRGVQSFYLPTSIRDFYRFIRIDFRSHYGNEYYCPVSLLRVYGLTHLEEWKWDMWQAETHERSERSHQTLPASVEVISSPSGVISRTSHLSQHSSAISSLHDVSSPLPSTPSLSSPISTPPTTHSQPITKLPGDFHTHLVISSISHTSSISTATSTSGEVPSSAEKLSNTNLAQPTSSSRSNEVDPTAFPSLPSPTSESRPPSDSIASQSQPTIHANSNPFPSVLASVDEPTVNVIPVSQPPTVPATSHIHAPAHPQPHGESIYRTIMNRLTAVENNQTLYMKYVEQQHAVLRDVIKRLGEDLGRLEGITRAQGVTIQRTFDDWDKQRYQLQMESRDILQRIESLSEEIILEKRLGVAQLCLLLAVLIFLGLTRGSRAPNSSAMSTHQQLLAGKHIRRTNNGSGGLREWGRRHLSLSFSGDSAKASKSEAIVLPDPTRDLPASRSDRALERRRLSNRLLLKPLDVRPLGVSDSSDENTGQVAFPTIPPSTLKLSNADLREHSRPLSPIHLNRPENQITQRVRKLSNSSTHRQRTRTISNSHSANSDAFERPLSGTTTPTSLLFNPNSHPATSTALRTAPLPGHHVIPAYPRRATHHVRPITPTKGHSVFSAINGQFRPGNGLQRSHSHGGVRAEIPISATGAPSGMLNLPQSASWGIVPKSAKRWARSAHLHEVKNLKNFAADVPKQGILQTGISPGNETKESGHMDDEDVFSASFSSLEHSPFGAEVDTEVIRRDSSFSPSTGAASLSALRLVGQSTSPTVNIANRNLDTATLSIHLLEDSRSTLSAEDTDLWTDTDTASNFDEDGIDHLAETLDTPPNPKTTPSVVDVGT